MSNTNVASDNSQLSSSTSQEEGSNSKTDVKNMLGNFSSLIPLLLITAVFYFLVILPQQKRAKEQKSLINKAKKGDKVLMANGIYGVIDEIKENDEVIRLQISEGVIVKMLKSHIATVESSR